MTENPVLVEVTRGGVVESRHRGAFCVIGPDGSVVASKGDIEQGVFPRSSIKAIQALPLVESGAADAFDLDEEELALACASHGGEIAHVSVAQRMLNKMGLSEAQLQCGSHWPMFEAAGRRLAMEGEKPSALHNNCSGKHAGFLAYLKHNKVSPVAYGAPDHPLQVAIQKALEEVCEVNLSDVPRGIDGCAIPTWAIPLRNLALGFSKYARPDDHFKAVRANAVKRITAAVFAHPFMVAGTDRYCSRLMQAFPGRVFAKVGAEGVYTAFVRQTGHGIAIKCDDGAFRGAEITLSAVLEDLGVLSAKDFENAGAMDLYEVPLTNRNGIRVGDVRRAF